MINTWSMYPLPFLKSHCSSPIAHSAPSLFQSAFYCTSYRPHTETNTIRVSTFIIVPHRGTIHAPRKSMGTTTRSIHSFNGLLNHSNAIIQPYYKHSSGKPSNPGAFTVFISFTTCHTFQSILYYHSILSSQAS